MTVAISNSLPSEHEMMVYHTMAEQAVSSKMYKGIGEKAGVMMIMLSARELGIPAMQALNGGINIINGKAEISARMMSALIRKAGHKITLKENTDISCTLVGTRCDTGEVQAATYTFAEAQKAGLVKPGGGWMKNPKDMVFARALSRLARQLFSDVIGIGYVEGEIRASEADLVMPDDIPAELPETPVDHKKNLDAILNIFAHEDKSLVFEYLKAVMQHFAWTEEKAALEFLKDPSALFTKFNTWKNKRKVNEIPISNALANVS
jgi:hypothetical protein